MRVSQRCGNVREMVAQGDYVRSVCTEPQGHDGEHFGSVWSGFGYLWSWPQEASQPSAG